MPRRSEQHKDVQRILLEHSDDFAFMEDLALLDEDHRIRSELQNRDFEIDMLFQSVKDERLVLVELKLGDRDITDTRRGKGEAVIRQILDYRDALLEGIRDIDSKISIDCILLAHRIASEVQSRASETGIRCVEISMQDIIRVALNCEDSQHTHIRFSEDERGDYLCEDGRIWSREYEELNLPLVGGRDRPFSQSKDRNAAFAYIKTHPGQTRQEIVSWAKEQGVSTGAVNIVLKAKERIKYDEAQLDQGLYTILWP